jgi:hypothetical protein
MRMRKLHFFTFQAVVSPLPNSVLLRCCEGFVLESAKALRELHRDGIAHLDVRTSNVGFRIVKPGAGHGAAPARAARAVLIDLDRGVWDPDIAIHFSSSMSAQYDVPHDWPADVVFSAVRCDWRQWALMIWSLLVPGKERDIYSKRKAPLGPCPFAFLQGVICAPDVGIDEDALPREIAGWVGSPDIERAKLLHAELNTSDLTAEVRLDGVGSWG